MQKTIALTLAAFVTMALSTDTYASAYAAIAAAAAAVLQGLALPMG